MANVPQKTLNWLYNVLTKDYRDLHRAYSDLAHTLDRFPTLSPRTDVYTFENGASALLVHLVGTLPVSFRNMTYRFPVDLWMPHTYPYEAPMAYVTPTSDMLVRPGRHVSGEGRIYHPYLAHWAEAWNKSSVVELLSILCDIFSREPPVMSRQQSASQPPQQSPRPPPLPPQPSAQSRHPPLTSTGSSSEPAPPPPPPKQHLEAEAGGVPKSGHLGRYDAPPPLPEAASSSASLQNVQARLHTPSSQVSSPGDASARRFIPAQNPQQEQQFNKSFGRNLPTSVPPIHSPQQMAPRPPHAQGQAPPHQNRPNMPPEPPSSQADPSTRLQQGHKVGAPYQHKQPDPTPASQPKPPPVDLLDSPFDLNLPVSSSANIPVPPVPPNPEKDALLSALSQSITQALHNSISTNTSSIPLLRSQNEALHGSLQTLESELSRLQSLHSTVTGNISTLQASLREADTCISSAHARAHRGDIPRIDDMLVAPTVVGKQLYDVVCEERAIEAAAWSLQAALTRGRVGVDVWARKTRELRREQFRRKVLLQKIGRGMGLEGVV